MRNILQAGLFISSAILLLSCGASKKLESANAQIQTLTTQVTSLNSQVADDKKTIDAVKTESAQYSKDAMDCRAAKEAADQKLADQHKKMEDPLTSLQQANESVKTSLEDFANAGIEVTYNNGLIRISMPDYLIFISGGTRVGWEGQQALKIVAEELQKYPKLQVYVVGNTDNTPVKSGTKDNWSISTERANAIVRVLTDTYGFDPARLIPGGRSMYNPIADNSTDEGKIKNRRTDIILNPDFSSILQ